uniref:Uncharacterized protein n=1 Tax=Timema monikensis TaxID=170555 RepID=A0A7R9EH00_9NEOP|nr:unnamed protein product [Timema monikensis]
MLRCHDNDAAFIFSKFRVDGAFMASASVRQYGLEKSFRKYYSCKEKMPVEKCGLTPRIQKILDDGSFDDILRVQEKCIAIKKSLQQFKGREINALKHRNLLSLLPLYLLCIMACTTA